MRIKIFFSLLVLCPSCRESPHQAPPCSLQHICGRDEILDYGHAMRRPLYQVKVPLAWKRVDPSESDSLLDTKKPIVTFIIEQNLHLVVHNFPSQSIEERIDPSAQIERWAAQLKGGVWRSERVGHDGFSGFYFEGNLESNRVCAWSLQLDAEHYQTLHFLAATVEEEEHYRQMGADYTVKVSGPAALIEKYKDEIALFVTSFQLIQEIPARL